MARNSEKQYGRLNRLLLSKEKEEYEKSHPKRPNLNSLDTVEEIQKWLPSIKQDMNFYLMKSQVICYSDDHIEECKQKVVSLEKEYKAFVRKIKQFTPGILDAVPWTSRSYKRKCLDSVEQPPAKKEFTPILITILDREPKLQEEINIPVDSLPLMDQPLTFVCNNQETEHSAITSTSSGASLEPSVCEKSLQNYLKSPFLTKESPNSLINNPSLSLMDQPLIFKSDIQKTTNSKQELSCDISSNPSEYEHSNHTKSSCLTNETKESLFYPRNYYLAKVWAHIYKSLQRSM